MKPKIIEFILVMSCFLLMFLVNFIQSAEQRDTIASVSALRLKEKLNLEDAQATAIKNANVKLYEALSVINRAEYNDENTYRKAIQMIRHNYQEKVLQSLTQQQREQWQNILMEECLDDR